jgi:hypothetical protein
VKFKSLHEKAKLLDDSIDEYIKTKNSKRRLKRRLRQLQRQYKALFSFPFFDKTDIL